MANMDCCQEILGRVTGSKCVDRKIGELACMMMMMVKHITACG